MSLPTTAKCALTPIVSGKAERSLLAEGSFAKLFYPLHLNYEKIIIIGNPIVVDSGTPAYGLLGRMGLTDRGARNSLNENKGEEPHS